MFRPIPTSILVTACLCAARLVFAQNAVGNPPEQAGSEAQDSKHLSSHISAVLMEKLPTYTAVTETKPEAPAESAPETVVLEKRVVYGAKARTFTEAELANSAGLAALLRRQFSISSLPLNRLMPDYAALMQADNARLESLAEFGVTVENLRLAGDTKASKELREEIARAFIRGHDWRTEALDRSFNNNRR